MKSGVLDLFHFEFAFEVKLNFYMQFKSRDVAHEGSTMKIDYNTRFLLAVRRKRKIIGYFIGHSDSGHTRRRKSFAASRYLCMVIAT